MTVGIDGHATSAESEPTWSYTMSFHKPSITWDSGSSPPSSVIYDSSSVHLNRTYFGSVEGSGSMKEVKCKVVWSGTCEVKVEDYAKKAAINLDLRLIQSSFE